MFQLTFLDVLRGKLLSERAFKIITGQTFYAIDQQRFSLPFFVEEITNFWEKIRLPPPRNTRYKIFVFLI